MNIQNKTYHFVCPQCKGKVNQNSIHLYCTDCNKNFLIDKNILDFRLNRLGYFFNPVSTDDMDKLISNMNERTWAGIIKSFISYVGAKRPNSWIDNLVVDSRYAWKIFLDLNKEKTLLDIGCGLGNLASNLAPHVGKTYAMDLTYKRLEFAEKRISIFNAQDDVEFIAGGDGEFLPFPDNSIDCVTLSGVLEWVGEGDLAPYTEGGKSKRLSNMIGDFFGKKNPRNIQIEFLKEIKRILKNNGQLFIGIENRLNYEYFTGRPDHHSNLKYASLLPRFIANIYSIIKSKKPYRTYTYSIPGYKKILTKAGFNNTEFFGLTDGYSFLNEIYPAENNDSSWQKEKIKGLKKVIKNNKYFIPAYGIIASGEKKSAHKLYDGILSEIEKKINSGSSEKLTTFRYIVTKKEKLVIKARIENKNIIIKIPFNKSAIKSENNNQTLLEKTRGLKISPDLITKVSVDGLTGYVEEMLEGEAICDVYAKFTEKEIYTIISNMIEKKNSSDQLHAVGFNGILYKKTVENPLKVLYAELKNKELDGFLKQFFNERLYDKSVVVGLTHGDMSVSNILVSKNKSAGLIDWEAGNTQGLPILDVINYLGSESRFKNPDYNMLDTLVYLTSKDFMTTNGGKYLKQQYQYFNMSFELHEVLVYLNWLHNIVCLLPFNLKYNQKNLDRFIFDVVKYIKST